MRRKALLIALLLMSMGSKAEAFTDCGWYVVLEDGESYGSVASAYGLNYYDLGRYNGVNPDDVVVHAGDTIAIGAIPYDTHKTPDYTYYLDNGTVEQGYETGVDWQDTTGYESGYVYADDNGVYGSAYISAGYTGNAGINVSRACELNNGVVIPAGGTYCASNYIGAGDASMGFVEAMGLMADGSSVPMYGSGICPVTTAIYQAGRDAGLEVVARQPHVGGACSYAPEEENQAMYNYGTSDLVMVNPYPYPIELKCGYDGYTISAVFE